MAILLLFVILPSRDTLKNKVAALNNNIMRTPKEIQPVISIVGLSENYKGVDVVDMLVQQNNFLKQFSENNNIQEHINVFAVKPLCGKPDIPSFCSNIKGT